LHPGYDVWSKLPQIAEKYGLYDPFYVQYINWLRITLTEFTLGYSVLYDEWVSVVILEKFPVTLELIMYSAPIIVFGGIKLGVYSARRIAKKGREDTIDFIMQAATTWAYSIPIFFIGILMLSFFFLHLRWVDVGRLGTDAQRTWQAIRYKGKSNWFIKQKGRQPRQNKRHDSNPNRFKYDISKYVDRNSYNRVYIHILWGRLFSCTSSPKT